MVSENGPAPGTDASAWIDLPARASISVKNADTGRELRFEGAGRVRPCAEDLALVAEGAAVGLPGGGEGPGSEQWVAAACGVAVWSAGIHRFAVTGDTCRLQSSTDAAWVYVAVDGGARDLPQDGGAVDAGVGALVAARFHRLAGRHALELRVKADAAGGRRDGAVKAALDECARAARDAEDVASRLRAGAGDAGPDRPAGIGELAVSSMGARRLARAACAVARVRVAAAGEKPADVAALAAALARFTR